MRVFVSSTLKELEPERRAARAAIERMHLAPVMFELGARPHPPQQLYRAYLEQSDVFVGVYWQQYGWIAPGEEISGLEDEYRLAPRDMPKLIYVKQPAEREERLAELMARIRDDDTASYTPFSTAEELAELIAADLATLLAERFDASRAAAPARSRLEAMPAGRIPAPYSDAVGRERDLATLLEWLGEDAQRLVTLVGPGGIGKSRLAIEVARNAGARFDRVTFVTLAQVRDPDEVLGAIARELGVRDTGDAPLSEQLGIARAGRRDLIVLDNFEQVVDAAPDVVSLLTDLPGATFLVTSRVRLRVRGEQVFDVEPLGLPPEPSEASIQAILEAPAVRLFRDRARAADPRFEVTDENAEDVARICRALEGVPLAIELAAARIRALTPAAMLGRLDRVLPLLVTAARDVPERQRTIQATVEWSIDLLGRRRAVAVRATRGVRRRLQPRRGRGRHGRRTMGRRPARHHPRARRRQPPASARRPRRAALLDAGPGARDRRRAIRARAGCRGGATRARRVLRQSRRRDRAAAAGRHPVRRARRLEANATTCAPGSAT